MSAFAPDPTSHELTKQSEGDGVRLTCSAIGCEFNYLASDDRFVSAVVERHQRATDTYKGK
jgi:hypothetical protein